MFIIVFSKHIIRIAHVIMYDVVKDKNLTSIQIHKYIVFRASYKT